MGENADAGIADNGVNGNNEANGGQAGAGGIGGENVELGDEEVPLDLMELDDEEMPLADNALEGMPGMEEGSRIFAVSAILVAASVGVLILFAFWVKILKRQPKYTNIVKLGFYCVTGIFSRNSSAFWLNRYI